MYVYTHRVLEFRQLYSTIYVEDKTDTTKQTCTKHAYTFGVQTSRKSRTEHKFHKIHKIYISICAMRIYHGAVL